jgi:TonB-linked SusC/RagA family outer membrane protein
MKKTKVILLLLLFPVLLFAQELTITGKVTEISGIGIPGVSVVLKGTTVGTITDADGQYSISKVPENSILTFSFVGMKTQEIPIDDKTSINVTMVEDAIGIEEVIAVGYGTQKKATLSGSVASIKSEDIVASKNQNVQNMLTGKLAGVRVVQKTSEPGVFNNQFDIRGFGSPLIVIDGVPRGDIQRIDPNEIESISVLKDASAAVYGVRAANGVVLITTKKGKHGAPKLSYSMYYGFQVPAEVLKPTGAIDRMTLYNERSMRSVTNPNLTYSDEEFEKFYNGTRTSTDWYNAVMKDYAPQQQHNVNLSGGADRVDYFVNLGYLDQRGFWKSGDLSYERFNMRSNINAKVSDRINFSLKLNGILDDRNAPDSDAWTVFKTLWRTVPDEPIFANNTQPFYQKMASDIDNVYAMTNSDVSGFEKRNTKIFNSSMELSYDIPGIEGLVAKGLFSYDTRISDNSNFSKSYNEYRYDEATEAYTSITKNAPTSLDRSYGVSNNTLYQISLSYDQTFADKHNINTLLLLEGAKSKGDNIYAAREFSIPLPYLFAGNAENQEGTANPNGINEYASNGLVGKLTYDYEGKYLLDLNFRYDGSSRFPENERWGFFPGGSIGWRISEESFLKNNLSYLDNLKIRASYGKMGDDGALDYQYLSGYDYPNTSGAPRGNYPTGYMFDGSYTNALGFRAAPNPNITWYTVNTFNVGLDTDFGNGKLGFTFDYFNRERDGLLANRLISIPGTFGSTMPQENLNGDQTNGVEFELRHRNRIGELSYNVSGNVAITRTKRLYVERANSGNSYDNWRNNRANRYNDIWFGYGDAGRYASYEEIANSNIFTNIATLPGDYIYKDWNEDGIIDGNDKYPIATTSYPLLNFGINIGAQYKNIDLTMLFQGASMYYIGMGEQLSRPLMWDGNALDYFMDRWRPVDPKSDPYDPANEWITGDYAYGAFTPDNDSEFRMQEGTYVRLKNIELGYTIPKQILNKININKARLFINGYNLLTFTGVKGIDPEKPEDLYGYMYPLNQTLNFGAEITF